MGNGFFGGSSKAPDAVRFPAMAQLRAYWHALCDAPGVPPLRSRIDPRGIADALDQTFLIERVAPGIARFRLAGMHLADVMGMDARGMVVSTLFDTGSRAELATALEAVFIRPAMVEIAMEAERGLGRPALEARMLLLPLRGDDSKVSLALGCLATDGMIGRAPRRFATARRTITPLTTTPVLPEMEHGMAEAPAPFVPPPLPPSPPTTRSRAHLRLVKS
jgi:hypothetical protein